MRTIQSTLRYVVLVILTLLVTSYFNPAATEMYRTLLPNIGGSFDIDFTGVTVLIYSLEFLAPFLFILFGDNLRYWAVGMFTVLILTFEVFSDQFHIYIPFVLLAAGILSGLFTRWLAATSIGKMPQFAGWKKYF